MDFYFFRHGQTDWNKEHKIQGHTDVPLNEIGKQEALELGKRLKGLGIEKVYSSDLSRALETAKLSGLNVEVEKTSQLREACFGIAEGKKFEDVLKEHGKEFFSLDPSVWELKIEGGESKQECILRVKTFLNKLVEKSEHKTIGISTHGGVIVNIVHSILPPDSPKIAIPNCCIYKVVVSEDWVWSVEGPL